VQYLSSWEKAMSCASAGTPESVTTAVGAALAPVDEAALALIVAAEVCGLEVVAANTMELFKLNKIIKHIANAIPAYIAVSLTIFFVDLFVCFLSIYIIKPPRA
jgi:hypothetical protein